MVDVEEAELLKLQQQFLDSNAKPAAKAVRHPSRFKQTRQAALDPDERFQLDLNATPRTSRSSNGLLKDIVERDPNTQGNEFVSNGGPSVRKLDWRTRGHQVKTDKVNTEDNMSSDIAAENAAKLNTMSADDLIAEREELLNSLTPEQLQLLQRKYKRDMNRQKRDLEPDEPIGPVFESYEAPIPKVSTTNEIDTTEASVMIQSDISHADSPQHELRDLGTKVPDSSQTSVEAAIHFPTQSFPEPDPNSETFFQDLKQKYFPNLDYDPASMKWMLPPSVAEDLLTYHESAEDVTPVQIRFDFQGNFVTPRDSRSIDKTLGLHHHAEAPLAAGYTIPELAHLARSTHASQACMAIQTIGRIMYKIGKAFYGAASPVLRQLVEDTKVEQTLLDRARDRHLSISSYATEALWQANLGRQDNVVQSA